MIILTKILMYRIIHDAMIEFKNKGVVSTLPTLTSDQGNDLSVNARVDGLETLLVSNLHYFSICFY